MRISIIGPGVMPIPPSGWGAVEILIWDYCQELVKQGHDVQIVNTKNTQEIVNSVNEFNPDFVHLQYDEHYHVMDQIKCKNKAATSHYGYLEVPHHLSGGYNHIFRGFVNGNFDIFCLSDNIKKVYMEGGAPESRLYVTPNGARSDLFSYMEYPEFPDLSIYLAKITDRKKQYLYQDIDFIHFAGNLDDSRFNQNRKNYIGEWTKDHLYSNLSKYSNLVLLSDGEAHPLVCCEALISGLGLVISEYAAGNLDSSLPFIEIIPNEKLNDISYVSQKIKENQSISNLMRTEIRRYGLDNFDWSKLVKRYTQIVEECMKKG
jgi:glycosyltransferase involved in cell wall biosynthesis